MAGGARAGLETLGVGVCFGLATKLVASLWLAVLAGVAAASLWVITVWAVGVEPASQRRTWALLSRLRVGAHRGAADDAPENTLYAFAQAREHGADFVELDLMFTQEGIPIVFHDERLERTTDGRGLVRQTSFHNIARLNAADKWDSSDHSIPTLHESIAAILDLGLCVVIDVKCPHPQVVPTITALYAEFPSLYCFGLVSSFHPLEILALRRADPAILAAHTWCLDYHAESVGTGEACGACGTVHRCLWAARLLDAAYVALLHSGLLLRLTGVNVLLAHHSAVSALYVEALSRAGLHPIAWTVNDLHHRLFLLTHLRIPFITDRVKDLEHLLKAPHQNPPLRAPFRDRSVCLMD